MSKKESKLPKLVVLLGPTASGKTGWSLDLAKKFNGDVISADSRQIYKKMDIGTAKAKGEWRRNGLRKTFFVDGVPHHLVDFLDPGKTFTVAEFRDYAIKYVKLAYKNGKVPMLVGGTGLYISSVVDNFKIPRVAPNKKLRASLLDKTNEELFDILKNLDPETAGIIDKNNKRRMIRALEVCIFTGESFSSQKMKGEPIFDVLQIGIEVPKEELLKRIEDRTEEMFKDGLLNEVEKLVKQKYGWNLPSMSGIGYREFNGYFTDEYDLEEVKNRLKKDTKKFVKRQMTWFRRDKRIKWVKTCEEAEKLIKDFL